MRGGDFGGRDPPSGRGGGVWGLLAIAAIAIGPLLLAVWLAPLRAGHSVQPNPYVLIWTPVSLVPLVLLGIFLGWLERRRARAGVRAAAIVLAAAGMLLVLELVVRLFGGFDTVSEARELGSVRWLHDSGFSYSAAEPIVLATAAQLQILLAPLTLKIADWALKD